MYQQQMPHDERDWQASAYANKGAGPEYEEGYKSNPQYNDQLAEAILHRLRLELRGGLRPAATATPGMRLALAIVSLAILIPLAAIILGIAGIFAGLLGLGLVCLAVIVVNIVFNIRT
jgi:hypothetical protein